MKKKWVERPPSRKHLRKREARTIENLNATREQTGPKTHSRECSNIWVLLTDHTGEVVVTVHGLIDSGCTWSILLKNFVERKRLRRVGQKKPIEYQTYGGSFKARKTDFLFLEISTSRKVEWEFTVDKQTDAGAAPYDMIIATDLLTELEMDLKWDYWFMMLIMSVPII